MMNRTKTDDGSTIETRTSEVEKTLADAKKKFRIDVPHLGKLNEKLKELRMSDDATPADHAAINRFYRQHPNLHR